MIAINMLPSTIPAERSHSQSEAQQPTQQKESQESMSLPLETTQSSPTINNIPTASTETKAGTSTTTPASSSTAPTPSAASEAGSPRKRTIDFEKIRGLLQEETNAYLKGVKDTDVDWFIRDTSMNTNVTPSTLTLSLNAEAKQPILKKSTSQTNFKIDPSVLDQGETSPSGVSSHLSTNISNTNDNISSKTKPSLAEVQEESISSSRCQQHHVPASTYSPSRSQSQPQNEFPSRRRKSSTAGSVTSTASTSSLTGGLFSKLKGKLHIASSSSANPSPSSSPPTSSSAMNKAAPSGSKPSSFQFKPDYDLRLKKKLSDSSNSSLGNSPVATPTITLTDPKNNNKLTNHDDTSDPRLEEYIKFYLQKDIRRSSVASRKSSVVSNDKYPTALVNCYEANPSNQSNSTSKLSSFLRRKSAVKGMDMTKANDSTPSLASVSTVSIPIPPISGLDLDPSFKGLKPLKRVAFHSSTFLIDPPQQIPSRNPRKGNVEILANGTYLVHPLTPEDKIAMEKSQLGMGGGIIVGGSGALGYMKKEDKDPEDEENKELSSTTEETNKSSNGEEKETQSEAEPKKKDEPEEEDEEVNVHARSLGIDKPLIPRTQILNYKAPVKKMALDTMYARCCHLREILPIPAILKQIPKGSMAPLPVLQLRNPNPTMVEIQTFADFVRIAPVVCISLDGVSLSVEQFKILLASMSAKTQLEKLSLRNTPINEEGWSLLCWFLSRNKVLNKLDITQCPSLAVNILKKRRKRQNSDAKKYEEKMTRMTCNRDNRSDVDWSLFVATLVARGGIEELILTGCCITDIHIFEKLMKLAVLKKTSRLGLAFNQLSTRHFKIVVNSWLFQEFARGLDLGYNDFLSVQFFKILLDYSKRDDFDKVLSKSTLSFLSLNSSNCTFTEIFKEVFENVIMKFPNLKYLDLSNNKKLFGTFGKANNDELTTALDMDLSNSATSEHSANSSSAQNEVAMAQYFTSRFPLFPKLIRLHLENENFSQASVLQIARILPFCKNLGYFSILGNKIDLTSASALVNAVKNSKTLINLDCNLLEFPDLFKERVGLYTMRNMERLLYASKKVNGVAMKLSSSQQSTNSEDETESLTEQLNNILALKAQQKLDLKSPEVTKFISRAQSIRLELRETIDDLLKLQLKNALDLDGKETLIRFIFIDSSIEKGLQLIDSSLVDNEKTKAELYLTKVGEREKDHHASLEYYQDRTHEDHLNQAQDVANNARSPMRMSRSSSRNSISSLEREEGSILKLSRLRDFHRPGIGAREYEGLSGEELRKKLMSVELSDLDKIIGFLGRLREKGVSLENIFQNHGEVELTRQVHDVLDMSEIKQKLKAIADCIGKEKENEDKNKEKELDIDTNEDSSEDKPKNEDKDDSSGDQKPDQDTEEVKVDLFSDINETYDKVLRSLTN